MTALDDIPKRNYLTIPIEMYSCEVIIKKSQRLTEMEKIILKYIYEEDSVKKLLTDFSFDHFLINKSLAKLLYRGLLRLKLDSAKFQVSNKISPFIKNNTLDDYLDEGAISESRSVSILQEKISGEIFLENEVKEYLTNPGSLTTNYLDLKIVDLDLFPDIKDLSLDKFVKCIRNQIKIDIDDIQKVNILHPRHYTKLYIPLIEKESIKYIDLELETFPRRVQKAWQNAYEIDFVTTNDDLIEIYMEDAEYLSNNLFKIHLNKNLILFEDSVKKIDKSPRKKKRIQELLMINDDIKKGLNSFTEKIKSVNRVSFHHNSHEFTRNLKKYLELAEEYIIVCSTHLGSETHEILPLILEDFSESDVKIIVLWNDLLDFEDKGKIYGDIKKKFKESLRKNLYLIQSKIQFNSNFVLIDSKYIFFTSYPIITKNIYENNESLPFIIAEGGTIPYHFIEFCCDLIPQEFELKRVLQEKIKTKYDNFNIGLSKERLSLITDIKNGKDKLKGKIMSHSFDELPSIIEEVKKLLKQLDSYDNVKIIRDIEHNDILIDAMREINKDFIVYTDEIHREQLSPHFIKYLGRLPKFQIVLNNIYEQDETQRNRGISKINKLIQTESNLKLEIRTFPMFNCLYVEDNFIIFSNNRFFARFSRRELIKEISIVLHYSDIERYDIFF